MKGFVIDRSYSDYVNEMRKNGVSGTHVEIQTMSDLYCRPVEVYQPQPSDEPIRPINIFQCTTASSSAPIRLFYVMRNHYEALIDPKHPSVGVGLGVKGLEDAPKVSVEETTIDSVMKESEREQLEQAMLQSVMDNSADAQQLRRAIAESDAEREQLEQAMLQSVMDNSTDAQQLRQAIAESDAEQLEKEMEQQARQQSLLDYMLQLSSQIVIPQPQSQPLPKRPHKQ